MICGLKHIPYWPYKQIVTATRVVLSIVSCIPHSLFTPTHNSVHGRHSILHAPNRQKLIALATASTANHRKSYTEIANMAGLNTCEQTIRQTISSIKYYGCVSRKNPLISAETRAASFLVFPFPSKFSFVFTPLLQFATIWTPCFQIQGLARNYKADI